MRNPSRFLASLAALTVLATVFGGLFSATTEVLYAVHSECSDGIDNDRNGKFDYPQDDQCESLDDDFEGIALSGNFVTLTDGREKVQPGDAVVYIVTLKQQRETSRNVTVDLHIPSQANIVSASDGGSVNGQTVRWTNVSVYNSATRTMQVHVNIKPNAEVGQFMVARAIVTGDSEATDTTLLEEYKPIPQNRYRVHITDNMEHALPGQLLQYTVKVKNIATHANLTDVRATMPYAATFQTVSNDGVRDGSFSVVWPDQLFEPNEERTYAFTALLDSTTTDRFVIRARATAGSVTDIDETIVRIGLPDDALSVNITDNREEAELGQILTYVIHVKNKAKTVGSDINVAASMPLYAEFISASEGGVYDAAGNIRWLVIGIAPGGERILQYSVRVRSDAPIGTILTAAVSTDGQSGNANDRDTTYTVRESNEIGYVPPELLFRKNADRGEAMPGGIIRYTITMKNTLKSVISDGVIVDKFNGRYLTLADYNASMLISVSPERLEWKVPVLKPGESWSTSYTVLVAPDAPHGLPIENVATLRGVDVSSISLTERVWTGKAGVITQFPQAGVSWDAYLLAFLSLAALGTAGSQFALGRGLKILG